MNTWPTHVGGGARKWKAGMRRRLRTALKTVDEARLGCAWNPEYLQCRIDEACKLLRAELDSCSAKRWGR